MAPDFATEMAGFVAQERNEAQSLARELNAECERLMRSNAMLTAIIHKQAPVVRAARKLLDDPYRHERQGGTGNLDPTFLMDLRAALNDHDITPGWGATP